MSHLSTFATKTKFINIDTLTAALTRCGFVDVGRTKFVSYADISDALRNNRPTQPIPSHECLRAFGVGPDIRQAAAQIRSEYSRQKLPLYELGIVQSKSDPQAYEVHGDFFMASDL